MPCEMELCQKFGVSRTTVREALRILNARGYIELRPNKGAFVISKQSIRDDENAEWFHLNAIEVNDMLEVRKSLEPLAAELAAKNGTMQEKLAIKGLSVLFEDAANNENVSLMQEYDAQFHEQIALASHNIYLADIFKTMRNSLLEFRMRAFSVDNNGSLAVPAHKDIADAIFNKEPEKAEQLMKKHMDVNISLVHKYK